MYQPFKFIFVVGNILKVPICTTFYLFSPKEIMVQGQERSVFTNVCLVWLVKWGHSSPILHCSEGRYIAT